MDELQFPRLAIRELVANALIHQDLTITGAGPMIEIFADRLEVTNPGLPLVEPLRFIDMAPRSRNEFIGSAMRQVASRRNEEAAGTRSLSRSSSTNCRQRRSR